MSLISFAHPNYQKHNSARLAHLASLELNLSHCRVLEVGSGPGDHTAFYVERDNRVVSIDVRQECLDELRRRFPQVETRRTNMNNPNFSNIGMFDVVHCYGLLYHLEKPEAAIQAMSEVCTGILLVETCVAPADELEISLTSENVNDTSQSFNGIGCRPTRAWVFATLKKFFPFVYQTMTQPRHIEFPLDWTAPAPGQLTRAIFIASKVPCESPFLSTEILKLQVPHQMITLPPQPRITLPPQPRVRRSQKPRALFVSDVQGWAFDQNCHDMAEYLDNLDSDHFYVVDWHRGVRPSWDNYDVVFECFHRNPPMGVPYDRAAGALRSQWFKSEVPALPDAQDVATVNRYRMFQVATQKNYDELIERCPNVVYLTNPINMRRFPSPTPMRGEIVAEWNGNSGHTPGNAATGRRIKHLHDVVVPACHRAKVGLHIADYMVLGGAERRRTPGEMSAFYQQANVALCASEYEAASFSVMESMASGLALIATDVGNHREMRDSQLAAFGDTGIILVEGTVDAFVAALSALTPARAHEMGRINREEIEARWSWGAWREKYLQFFQKILSK